jgi:hypothetical protein
MAANKLKKRNSKIREKKLQAISLLNISNFFEKLPSKLKVSILEYTWPKPAIIVDRSKDYSWVDIEKVCINIESDLKLSNIDFNSTKFSVFDIGDFLSLDSAVHSVLSFLSSRQSSCSDDLLFNLKEIEKKTSTAAQFFWTECAKKLIFCAWNEVSNYYDFSTKGLCFTLTVDRTPGKKAYQVLRINQYTPVTRCFNVDKKPRNAHLCFFFGLGNINDFPVVLKENTINNILPAKVYIQDHAINRLYERLKFDKNQKGYLFYNLGLSLISPEVVGKDGDSYLISFYADINGTRKKLGYLIVGFVEDIALIKSFKFLTMTGTPEHKALKHAFKACRDDLEYFNLDTIDFLNSDIFESSEIRQIFKRCNLSHLFDIKEKLVFERPEICVADSIKNYFRL